MSLMEQELLTLPEHLSSPRFLIGFVLLDLEFLKLCRSLFVLLSFSFWPLCILSFFDLRILISPLISSNIPFTVASIKHIYTYRRHTSHLRINKKHQNTDSWGANCIIVSIMDTTENEYKDTCFLQLIENIRQWLNFPIHQFLTHWLIVGDWWWVDFLVAAAVSVTVHT